MSKNSEIKVSAFSLAKEKNLTGDDYYDTQVMGNITIAIVCDGVGSAQEGAQAAKRVTNYLLNNFKIRPKSWSIEKSMKTFVESINSILYKESQINYERSELVTTLAMVVISGNRLYGINVGDSRVYLYRNDELNQLSLDHAMDEEGYENVLTQAIGISEDVQPYYFENIVEQKDEILLCSDGLYNVLDETKIKENIHKGAIALVKEASRLSEDRLPDDTTAVVLEILKANEREMLKQQKLKIPQTLQEGEVIDGYELQKPLIQNRRTWLVSKKTKQYVMKFAPVEAADDQEILDKFVKEAWNAKRLKADFFPKAVIPKTRTQRYYIMQLFRGEDLQKYLESHKHITIDDGVELATVLLKMSQYLLKYDLVHGDIKPDNIMIAKVDEDTTEYKIIDFGSITEIFSDESRAGTPSFLSPERFMGKAISESSEIFAIGVTLYLSLTGEYPYGEIEPFQTPTFKEAKRPSKLNSNIPDWLESVILRAIALDEKERYEHYTEMMYELTHPQKVKPYFIKNAPLIEKSPHIFYKRAFMLMTLLNVILIYLLLK